MLEKDYFVKVLSIKDVRSHGGRGKSSANILRTRGRRVLQMCTSALFGVKFFGFFGIYGVTQRTRRVEPVRTFFKQGGRGQFFVRASFMDGPKEKIITVFVWQIILKFQIFFQI